MTDRQIAIAELSARAEEDHPEHSGPWTTRGSVRGTCGHAHRTAYAAAECVYADGAGCRRQGGYSDRRVVPVRA